MTETTELDDLKEAAAARRRAAEAAETQITITNNNNRNTTVTETPAPQPVSTSIQTEIDNENAVPQALPTEEVQETDETHQQINWGRLVKGALIVTGVVVAAVVGFALLSTAAGWAISGLGLQTTVGSIAHGTITGVVPAIGHVAHQIMLVPSFLQGLILDPIVSLFGGVAAPAAVASGVAVTKMVAGLFGAGAAVSIAAPAAVHALHGIQPTDTVHTHTTTTTTTGLDQGGELATAAMVTKKKTILTQGESSPNAAHAMDDAAHQSLTSTTKTINKFTHPGTDGAKNANSFDTPDAPDEPERNTRGLLSRAAQANRAWTERTGRPARPAAPTPVKPRSAQFTEQLDADRARLEAALGDTGR